MSENKQAADEAAELHKEHYFASALPDVKNAVGVPNVTRDRRTVTIHYRTPEDLEELRVLVETQRNRTALAYEIEMAREKDVFVTQEEYDVAFKAALQPIGLVVPEAFAARVRTLDPEVRARLVRGPLAHARIEGEQESLVADET